MCGLPSRALKRKPSVFCLWRTMQPGPVVCYVCVVIHVQSQEVKTADLPKTSMVNLGPPKNC